MTAVFKTFVSFHISRFAFKAFFAKHCGWFKRSRDVLVNKSEVKNSQLDLLCDKLIQSSDAEAGIKANERKTMHNPVKARLAVSRLLTETQVIGLSAKSFPLAMIYRWF